LAISCCGCHITNLPTFQTAITNGNGGTFLAWLPHYLTSISNAIAISNGYINIDLKLLFQMIVFANIKMPQIQVREREGLNPI